MWHIKLGASHFENSGIKWGRGGLNPNISGLFETQLSQKTNKINFGNRNGKNDIPHQTNRPMSDTQHSRATLSLNFVAQQSCLGIH